MHTYMVECNSCGLKKNANLSSISSFALVARREQKSRMPQRKEALRCEAHGPVLFFKMR